MQMEKVASTYIKEIGFSSDPKTGGKIKIVFHSGYEEVREGTKKDFDSFREAKSVGKYYTENIKKRSLWKSR